MIKETRIVLNVMKRVKQFALDHVITPANPVVTATSTALGTSISTIETLDAGWDQGKGTFHGAAAERQFARTVLRDALSALSLVSKSLDKAIYPDVAAQLKMSNHRRTYQGLLAFGRAAVAIVEPMKQVFIDHGAAATVVEDLDALITALEDATNRKFTGLNSRVGKTAALRAEASAGMLLVRKLDGIYSQLYKNNVELYTAWKAAKRRQQTLPEEAPASAPAPVAPPSGS
jgi:hypothetical protein